MHVQNLKQIRPQIRKYFSSGYFMNRSAFIGPGAVCVNFLRPDPGLTELVILENSLKTVFPFYGCHMPLKLFLD